jgi:predicted metalloprotease with PDZ domain
MHMSLGITARNGYDWIVEGLAEYYSLQLLVRSGTISQTRYAAARTHLAEWAQQADSLCKPHSTGATTALAVGILASLDKEVSTATDGEQNLDDAVRALVRGGERADAAALAEAVEQVAGSKPDTLHSSNLPGCRNIAGD